MVTIYMKHEYKGTTESTEKYHLSTETKDTQENVNIMIRDLRELDKNIIDLSNRYQG